MSTHHQSQIVALHDSITNSFRSLLAGPARIEPGPRLAEWHRLFPGTEFYFNLTLEEEPERSLRHLEDECPVVPLSLNPENWWADRMWWVSWRDTWIARGDGKRVRLFELKDASMHFFWGRVGERHKDRVLRAEWSQPPKHGGIAGQPHWHVDPYMRSPGQPQPRPDREEDGNDLEELPELQLGGGMEMDLVESTDRQIHTAGLHLAMAGWELQDVPGNSYQRCVNDDLATLQIWAECTLFYASRQLQRVRQP